MRKTATIMIALATMAFATPMAEANESVTQAYTRAAGYYAGPMPIHPLAG